MVEEEYLQQKNTPQKTILYNKLHEGARKIRKTVVEQLGDEISLRDEIALDKLVITYSTYLEATEKILDKGYLEEVEHRGKTIKKESPWVKIQLNAQIQLLKLLQEFGMTPRSRLKKEEELGESDLERLINALQQPQRATKECEKDLSNTLNSSRAQTNADNLKNMPSNDSKKTS